MRQLVIAAAVLLAACSVETGEGASVSFEGDAGPYAMQIVADEDAQIYYVTGPEDRAAAARVAAGASSLMDVGEARLAVGEARAAAADLGPVQDEALSIRVPGFSLVVAADEDSPGEDGRAQIMINAGGREVQVDANGEGEAGNAVVRITGASESDARDFINEAEDLSDETKAQMRAALGLS